MLLRRRRSWPLLRRRLLRLRLHLPWLRWRLHLLRSLIRQRRWNPWPDCRQVRPLLADLRLRERAEDRTARRLLTRSRRSLVVVDHRES